MGDLKLKESDPITIGKNQKKEIQLFIKAQKQLRLDSFVYVYDSKKDRRIANYLIRVDFT